MEKYNVNGFGDDNITLISEWFLTLEKAKKFFDSINIGDKFTMKTISFESDELYELKNITIDKVDNMEDDWMRWNVKTLFSK